MRALALFVDACLYLTGFYLVGLANKNLITRTAKNN
jgi:hypothetical protein